MIGWGGEAEQIVVSRAHELPLLSFMEEVKVLWV